MTAGNSLFDSVVPELAIHKVQSLDDGTDDMQEALDSVSLVKLRDVGSDHSIYECADPEDPTAQLLLMFKRKILVSYVRFRLLDNHAVDEFAGQRKGAQRIVGESPITYLYRWLISKHDVQSDSSMTVEGFRMWQRIVRGVVSGKARRVFVSDFNTKKWSEVNSKNLTQPAPSGGDEVWWIEQLFKNASNTIFISKTKPTKFF